MTREQGSPEKWDDFNVNHYVRVKLTDRGRQILRENHQRLFGARASEFAHREPVEDAEGWSKWQLWSLMHELGYHCRMGFDPPFETTIKIDMEQRI